MGVRKNGLGKPSPFLLPKENQNENAAARGRSSCAEILLYHSPRTFVNGQIAQTFSLCNPEICAFCTLTFGGSRAILIMWKGKDTKNSVAWLLVGWVVEWCFPHKKIKKLKKKC